MYKRLLLVIFFGCFQIVNAQSNVALKKGNAYFKQESYYNAILNYEIYLGIRTAPINYSPYANNKKVKLLELNEVRLNKPHALDVFYNLAESYRHLNDYSNAYNWYTKVLLSRTSRFPLALLWHGVCLRALGDYDNAEKELKGFIEVADTMPAMSDYATKELNNINFIIQQTRTRKPPAFSLHKLKGDLNTIEGAYALTTIGDTMIFTSARVLDSFSNASRVNTHVNHLYTNVLDSQNVIRGRSSLVKLPPSKGTNEGTATFSSDNNIMLFSRSDATSPTSVSAIFMSKKQVDGTWGTPVKLNENINKSGFNSNQPFLTDDGKFLLFASDMPGGVGKYDIWASPIDSIDKFGIPFNLSTINSKEDDRAPFYHTNEKSLVFSSNGRVGMGGFDLYVSVGDLKDLKIPVNLGGKINSIKDECYFYSSSKDTLLKRAYVSSDRFSDCCLELFYVKRLPIKLFKQKVDGLVIDCKTKKPLEKATVLMNVSNNANPANTFVTDANGRFQTVLSENTTGFTAKRKLGFYEEKEVNLAYDAELYADTTYPLTICLTKSSKRYKQVIDAELIDCDTKKPINKAYVTAINSFDSSKNITYKTTNRGQFMFDLNDSSRTILFEKKDYFDKDTLSPYSDLVENDTVYKMTYCIELYSAEKVPIAMITDPTKVNSKINEINRRDSTVIYFDFNKTDIKPEAASALDVILKDLKSYPSIDILLDISGHTDSKGSAEVNFRIGRQRAISCLDYLISKGIPESRLRLRSPGKFEPVAKETINKKDNPAGRAKNRRVVLKVKATLAPPKQK